MILTVCPHVIVAGGNAQFVISTRAGVMTAETIDATTAEMTDMTDVMITGMTDATAGMTVGIPGVTMTTTGTGDNEHQSVTHDTLTFTDMP